MDCGAPAGYDPTSLSDPLLLLRLNDSIAELFWLPTNRYVPLGSLAITLGCALVVNGDPES